MRTLSFIILFITQNVRPEETADIRESEETTTTVYDVIINERDREINDIEINEIDSGREEKDENDDDDDVVVDDDGDEGEIDNEGQRGGGEDANKLLAAQVNAVHVLNMLKDLEEDMKVLQYQKYIKCFNQRIIISGNIEREKIRARRITRVSGSS